MKKYLHINQLIISIILFYSCSDKEPLIGVWTDNIKLSTKSAEFNASGDSITIKTVGSWWGISDISVDGKYYFGFTNVDLHGDSYSIKQDCFDVEHRDNYTLFIKVEANPNNVKRIITVGLTAGDYGDRVIITQNSK